MPCPFWGASDPPTVARGHRTGIHWTFSAVIALCARLSSRLITNYRQGNIKLIVPTLGSLALAWGTILTHIYIFAP